MLPISTDTTVSAASTTKRLGIAGHFLGNLQALAIAGGKQLECWARSVPFRFAIVTVTVLFALVITTTSPAFQTNDDALMCMIVSGQGITLAPDEHMVFTNVIIGKILKSLYTSLPGMLWYGWYLVATQWIVTVAILYCFLRPRYSLLRMWCFAVYFLTFGIYFVVNLQFTSTANMAGVASGILLLQVLRHPCRSRFEQISLLAVSCLLLIWGGLIRGDAFVLAMALVTPTLAVMYWIGTANRQTAVRACLSVVIAAGAMFVAERYHEACYSAPEWQAFYQYNPLRIKFNDEQWIKYTPESKHVFDQVGWSKNDYEMIINWYYDDPLYDQAALNSILTGYSWMHERNLIKTVGATLKDMWRQRPFQVLCFMLPAMLMFLDWKKRRVWPFVVAALTACGLLLAIVLIKKAPPERVFLPMLAFPWLVLLTGMTPCWRAGESHRRTLARVLSSMLTAWKVRNWTWWKPQWRTHLALRTISLCLLIGLGVSAEKYIRLGKANAEDKLNYARMLNDMRPPRGQPERLVMTFGADFSFEHQSVLFEKNDYEGLHFYCIGWPQRTPFAERMQRHHQIESVGQALAEKHDMLLIVNASAYYRILEYLADHFHSTLRIVNLKTYARSSLSVIERYDNTTRYDSTVTLTRLALLNLERNEEHEHE